ncbi:hypothetical protein AURANDRAFT_66776 [Aureococcus anophagefferens]|uniref:Uncharacterized protein n=1 Tax=Aureococcus anophagefferens TaxID=44056 RepID=F0YIR3_AURAN|nr:hypothetical protein AURANDRAFT_66776 [Aureococcus anophagefferens]EGB04937.1 hypothetical protein AURANDRAFT_66776 [Aureococcus anophagefferens]|eukprot:XP_009040292.1 hypothetical protein AURANDRAFT_66776 [Aureococcus anophagefferens]
MASGGMAARRNHREPKWEAIARPVGPHDTTPAVQVEVDGVVEVRELGERAVPRQVLVPELTQDAVAKGLSDKAKRTVYIAETCAFAMQKHIIEIRRESPSVTFSFEHPSGIVHTKPWFQDFIDLGLRRTKARPGVPSRNARTRQRLPQVSMCKMCGTKHSKTFELLTDLSPAAWPYDDKSECQPSRPCKSPMEAIQAGKNRRHPVRLGWDACASGSNALTTGAAAGVAGPAAAPDAEATGGGDESSGEESAPASPAATAAQPRMLIAASPGMGEGTDVRIKLANDVFGVGVVTGQRNFDGTYPVAAQSAARDYLDQDVLTLVAAVEQALEGAEGEGVVLAPPVFGLFDDVESMLQVHILRLGAALKDVATRKARNSEDRGSELASAWVFRAQGDGRAIGRVSGSEGQGAVRWPGGRGSHYGGGENSAGQAAGGRLGPSSAAGGAVHGRLRRGCKRNQWQYAGHPPKGRGGRDGGAGAQV